jgi:prephenate dehydratase
MPKKVAIQGIKGSFHDLVVHRYFKNNDLSLLECHSFDHVFAAISAGDADLAVIAIENTLAGSILPNYAHIQNNGFYVSGEIYLHIQMNLLAIKESNISDLKKVASHPMALLQCKEFMNKYPDIELVEISDTADGAREVNERNLKDVGIIASLRAAELYDMEVLNEGIETHKENYTRFLIITKEKVQVTNANKASICFELKHEVGSLVDILMIMKCHELNMTKIQSVPVIGRPYQYHFHVDVCWDNYEYYENAMAIVRRNVHDLQILGVYKQGDKSGI